MVGEPKFGSLLLLFSVLAGAAFFAYGLSISLLLYFWSPLQSLFFTSTVVIALLTLAVFAVTQVYLKQYYSTFTAALAVCCIGLGLFVFSVFGPVFIDRSLSYHLVMFASENGEVRVSRMEQRTAQGFYRKRFREASAAGLLARVSDDVYRPTLKAKLVSTTLLWLGQSTHSLDEYRRLEARMQGSEDDGR